MVKFSYHIGDKHFRKKLPSSFSDITIEQYLQVYNLIKRGEDDVKLYISLLSDTDYEEVDQFPISIVMTLSDVLQFIFVEDSVWVKDFKGYDFLPVGALQFLQFEDWKVKYSQLEDADLLIPYTVSLLYSGEYNFSDREEKQIDILQLPADIGIYCKNFYNIGLAEHQKKYAPLYQGYEPDLHEEEAGYNQISKWGYVGTLEALAGGDILKQKEIAKMCVDDVYTHLSYQKIESQYIKNYRKAIDNAIQRGDRID